ncbi:unnamed protein product [Caenorhabditis sp. 36 PRJEB53466]|nr:unnamed protein product [Caenorhabditis sp. 36 PRJEB53466]
MIHETSPNHDPLEDDSVITLIDAVERNKCVYNRYDPMHKVSDFKHKVWRDIADEIGYEGQSVELERKWKHMRDKYVRLRKQDKQKAPIKETNKWYNYYTRMSFLDPFVEHRNRKRQKDYIKGGGAELSPSEIFEDDPILEEISIEEILKADIEGPGSISPHTSSSGSSGNRQRRMTESPIEVVLDEESKMLLKLIEPPANIPSAASSTAEWCATQSKTSRKRKQIPTQILQEEVPALHCATSPKSAKTHKTDAMESLREQEDGQMLYCRHIVKNLLEMDKNDFSYARMKIDEILYDIAVGNNH